MCHQRERKAAPAPTATLVTKREHPKIITRSAAKAAGLKIYYMRPCKVGHICGRYSASAKCIECLRLYNATPAARNRRAAYRLTPKCRAIEKGYAQSEAGRVSQRRRFARYMKTPKGQETLRRWVQSPKGQESIRAATHRYDQSPKGRDRRYNETPKARETMHPFLRETMHRYKQSPKGRETDRRYKQSPKFRTYQAKWEREHLLDQARDDYDPVRAARLLARRLEDDT